MDAGIVAMSGQSGSWSEVSSELEDSGGMIVETYRSVGLLPFESMRTRWLGVEGSNCQLAGSVKRLRGSLGDRMDVDGYNVMGV
jgi:hypothetical protein